MIELEEQLNEAGTAGLDGWGKFVNGLVQTGTISPQQGGVLTVGVPLAMARSMNPEYVKNVKKFISSHKGNGKTKLSWSDRKLVSDTSDRLKDMPKGKQQLAAKLIRKVVSGDKNARSQAQKELKSYVSREVERSNEKYFVHSKKYRTAPKKSVSAAEKRLAPAGAKHAGFGRWVDSSGKTLGYTRGGKWVAAKQKNENIEYRDFYRQLLDEGCGCDSSLKED